MFRRLFVFVICFLVLFSSLGLNVAQAKNPNDKDQIKSVIDEYFKIKYESQKTLKIKNFNHMMSSTEKSKEFLKSETDKREIELYNAKINKLRYLSYEYFLEFKDLKINKKENTATLKVIEGHDVIFECHPDITSKMRNLEHVFTLVKTNEGWKIENDEFFDTKRQYIESSELSKEQIIEQLRLKKEEEEKAIASNQNNKEPSEEIITPKGKPDGKVLPLAGGWHSYNRTAAVNYAHQHAFNYNSAYCDYTPYGGDCTNFASQVIHAGGAPMDSTGSYRWYYYSCWNSSSSWRGVNELYNYLVNNWWTDPVGENSSIYGVSEGDLAQLNLTSSPGYEHSPVIVAAYWPRYTYNILVATHTADHDNYPLSSWGTVGKRYIHIQGYYD